MSDDMKIMLRAWNEDQGQRNMSVSLMMIQEKAVSIFQDLKKEHGECSAISAFSASLGWF